MSDEVSIDDFISWGENLQKKTLEGKVEEKSDEEVISDLEESYEKEGVIDIDEEVNEIDSLADEALKDEEPESSDVFSDENSDVQDKEEEEETPLFEDESEDEEPVMDEEAEEKESESVPSFNGEFFQEDEEDEEEETEGLYDVHDEALEFSSSNSDSISFDEVDNSSSGSEEEDETIDLFENERKEKFEDIAKTKKQFSGKKLNKNALLIFLGTLLFLFLLICFVNKDKKTKVTQKKVSSQGIDNSGYVPDFGDYMNRGKDSFDESMDEGSEYSSSFDLIESTEGKREFIPDNNIPKTTYQPTSGSGSSSGGGSSSYQNAVNSSLTGGFSGFGPKTGGGGMFDGFSPSPLSYGSVPDMTKEEFTKNYMDSIAALNGGREGNSDVRRFENGQYNSESFGGDVSYLPENSLYPGTVLQAVLVSGINTDYPGNITARIISPVYDSKTGKHLLIPQGSILRGSYSSASFGVNRVQIAWQTLILNRDGIDYMVNLGSMVGMDQSGRSGIKGSLNEHAFQYLKAMGLSCLFTAVNAEIVSVKNVRKNKTMQEMIGNSSEIGNQFTGKLMERALDITPTITVKGGKRITVDVDRVLTLMPYDIDVPKERYIRK